MCTQGAERLHTGFLVGASWPLPTPAPSSAAPDGLRAGGEDAAGFSLTTCFVLSSFILGDRFSHAWYFAKSTYFACLKKLESIFCYPLIRPQIHFYFQFFLSHRFCRGSPFFFFFFALRGRTCRAVSYGYRTVAEMHFCSLGRQCLLGRAAGN